MGLHALVPSRLISALSCRPNHDRRAHVQPVRPPRSKGASPPQRAYPTPCIVLYILIRRCITLGSSKLSCRASMPRWEQRICHVCVFLLRHISVAGAGRRSLCHRDSPQQGAAVSSLPCKPLRWSSAHLDARPNASTILGNSQPCRSSPKAPFAPSSQFMGTFWNERLSVPVLPDNARSGSPLFSVPSPIPTKDLDTCRDILSNCLQT